MNNPLVPTEMELVLEQTQQGTSHEVSSDTYVITMKMEILPVSTSNSTAIERFNTTARNPIKETLLKLSLPDHRSILKDSKIHIKMDMEGPELQERCIIQAFMLKNQEKYEHVDPKVTSTQDGKRSQGDDKRLCLVDDIKKLKITYKSSLKEQAQA
ncbi:hypothetical protein Tco_1059971 [Tanacetum coccineum]